MAEQVVYVISLNLGVRGVDSTVTGAATLLKVEAFGMLGVLPCSGCSCAALVSLERTAWLVNGPSHNSSRCGLVRLWCAWLLLSCLLAEVCEGVLAGTHGYV